MHDIRNQLTSIDIRKNRASSPFSRKHFQTLLAYINDYRSRRVYRKERTTAQNVAETTVTFNGGVSVQEYNGAAASGTPAAHYIRATDFGGGIGGILYSQRGSTLSYYHYNGRGDVTTKSNSAGTSATWQTATTWVRQR